MQILRKHWCSVIITLIVVSVLLMIVYALCKCVDLKRFLVPQSREYVIMFLEICIGIYATVVTLLASQKTKFTVALSSRGFANKFVVAISSGLIVNLITCLLLSTIKTYCTIILVIEITLCIVSFVLFGYFLIILIIMFKYNIDISVEEDRKETELIENMATDLEEIRKRMRK